MLEQQHSEALEKELQGLFDNTVRDPQAVQLNRLARYSAEIPKTVIPWFGPFIRNLAGVSCLALGLAVLSIQSFGDSSRSWPANAVVRTPDNHTPLNMDGFQESTQWESDIPGTGLDLLHGNRGVDEELLEESFQALLDESNRR